MQHNTHCLTVSQRRGLEKLGDIYAPGDANFPSFSQLGCVAHAPDILRELPDHDRRLLQRLLGTCRFAPCWLLGLMIRLAEASPRVPGPIGSTLRLLRLGLRSVVYTLYYSGRVGPTYQGPLPLRIIDFDVSVYTDDLRADDRDNREPVPPGMDTDSLPQNQENATADPLVKDKGGVQKIDLD